jgi:alkylhydroperoxidase/carboxymuconolactone decarboxylase family protein YurZ
MAQRHQEQYYRMQALAEQLGSESENVMAAFVEFQERVLATGALSTHIKRLMALGMAILLRCDDYLATYVHDALKAGATRNEILETIGVAMLMGGAPAVAYGSEALEALNQF